MGIKVLEKLIHAAVETLFLGAVSGPVSVPQVEIAKQWIVYETL